MGSVEWFITFYLIQYILGYIIQVLDSDTRKEWEREKHSLHYDTIILISSIFGFWYIYMYIVELIEIVKTKNK